MLVLQAVQEPSDNVRWAQHQVAAYWERQCLGQGALFFTDRKVVWISDASRTGFVLTYPAIAIHAAASANEDFPEPHLFLMVDVAKTDINYTPERSEVEEDDDEDSEVKTASVRFLPADSGVIQQLYQTMNECQELNPDPDEEISDEGDEEELELAAGGDGTAQHFEEMEGGGAQWYTEDTPSDEIVLSAEGRANLARMLGHCEEDPSSGTHENGHDDEQMDH